MPRTLTPQQFASNYGMSNNPTQSLGVDPTQFLQDFPDILPDLFSGITYFINLLDTAMGWTIPTTTDETSGAPTVLSQVESLLDGFDLTGSNSLWTQINTGPLAQDLQSLGTLINQQLGGTASTVNVFVTDSDHVYELAAAGNQFDTSLSDVTNPVGITFDSSGNMYVADNGTASVVMLSPSSVQTTLGFTGLVNPVDVAVDGLGNVYVADNSGVAYKLTTDGVQTTLGFTGLHSPTSIAVDDLGDVYLADSGAAKVFKLTGNTQSTMGFSGLTNPQGVLVDVLYNVYVSDGTSVHKLNAFNTQSTVGFTGLTGPRHLAIDSAGSLYVADGTFVYCLSTTGSQTTIGFTGLIAPVGVAVENAEWADIAAALQQITSQSQSGFDALLSDLGLSSLVGTGDDSLSTFLSGLQGDWNSLLSDLGLSSVSGDESDSLSTFLSEIETWWDDLFSGTSTTSGSSLATWLSGIDTDLTDLFSGTSTTSGSSLADFLNTLLGPESAVSASNLIGSIDPSLLSSVPVSSIGVGTPNYLANPGFDTAASVVDTGGQGWSFNGSVGHTNDGCAQVNADGTWKTLESNAVPVSAGETMPMSIWTEYVDAVSTALDSNDIQLNARAYLANAGGTLQLVSTTLLQAIQSPSGSSNAPTQNNFEELAGTYTVPSGVDHVSMQLAVSPNITAGTIRFDDGVLSVSGLLSQNLVQNLTSDFGNIIGAFAPGGTSSEFATGVSDFLTLFGLSSSQIASLNVNTVWTDIVNSIINPLNEIEAQVNNVIVDSENTLTNVFDNIFGIGNSAATSQVLAASVSGIGGQPSLGDALQQSLDSLVNGFLGTTTSGNSFGQLTNAASAAATQAANAQAVANAAALAQAQQVQAKAFYTAMDTTVDATFELAHVWALGSMPTITVTSAATAIGYVTCSDNVAKISVPIVAETTGTVTGIYINIYSVDVSTAVCTLVVEGTNILSEIGTLESLAYFDLASSIMVTPGDMYAIEVGITGTGSLVMLGMSPTWMPTNPVAGPATVGGTRSGAITSPPSSFTPSNSTTVPWAGLSALIGTVAPQYAPETTAFGNVGWWSPPSWFAAGNHIDYIMLGGGGGGTEYAGQSIGGNAGYFVGGTLVYGTDVQIGSEIYVGIGYGGTGGTNEPGEGGGATEITYTDPGGTQHTLGSGNARGGEQPGSTNTTSNGLSPGTFVYNDVAYTGGTAVGQNTNGSAPGGGGGGGAFEAGGNGAPGEAWMVARP